MEPSHGGLIGPRRGIGRLDFHGATLAADSIAAMTAAMPPRPDPMVPEQPNAEAANSPPEPLLRATFAAVGEPALLRLRLAGQRIIDVDTAVRAKSRRDLAG